MLWAVLLFCAVNINLTTGGCEKSFVVICDSLTHVKHNTSKNTWRELLVQGLNFDRKIPSFTLTSTYLQDLSELKWLIINELVTDIKAGAFTYCKNLQQLILYGNNIPTLKTETFFGLRHLSKLGLENNNIQKIERNTFYSSKIEIVDLSYNNLQVLTSNLFKKCHIHTLSVTHNDLWKIQIDSLPERLKSLHLDHNSFQVIPEALGELTELKELTLSHNLLSDIDSTPLQSIESLDLSSNQLAHVGNEFDHLKNLTYLNLSNNKLKKFTFTSKVIQNIKTQFRLLLAYNQLRNLDLRPIQDKEVTLTLFGNPWNCECLKSMFEVIVKGKIKRTICDLKMYDSGLYPYCIVDNQGCKENDVLDYTMEKFRTSFQNNTCNIIGDANVSVN